MIVYLSFFDKILIRTNGLVPLSVKQKGEYDD